jgi:hypothetical protein
MTIVSSLITTTTGYLGYAPKQLAVDLALEIFYDLRDYPSVYTATQIDADVLRHKSKIAMAIIEIDAKEGVEGQTSHNDNGTNRGYGTLPLPKAYATVVPFAKVI